MADLYVSLLGRPLRSVVAFANGRRAFVKMGDRRDDEFGLDPDVWIDREGGVAGAQAAYLAGTGTEGDFFRLDPARLGQPGDDSTEWTARELLGIVLRRIMSVAEAQGGEPVLRVVALLAPGADSAAATVCAQAALLAGALETESIALDACFTPPAGRVEIIVEAWDDVARVTALAGDAKPRTIDVSAELAPDRLQAMIGAAFTLPLYAGPDVHDALARELFGRWTSASAPLSGTNVVRPASGAAPASVFVPTRVFTSLDDELTRTLGATLDRFGFARERIAVVRVLGSWVRPLARACGRLLPSAVVRDGRAGELDAVVSLRPPAPVGKTPRLRGEVLAVAKTERVLRGIAQGAPVSLLAAGTRLPASAVFEDFASSRFIESFWIAARDETATMPMLQFAIPRYAERQQNSYLRAVVHCDTPDFVLLEFAYLYPSRRRFAFFDRVRKCEVPIAERAFRIVRGS